MSAAPWNREIYPGMPEFLGFDEEPGRQVLYMVDDRNGKVVNEVRKSQTVNEPKFKTITLENGDEVYVDQDGNPLEDETDFNNLFMRVPEWDSSGTKFKTVRRDWDYFVAKSERWNKKFPKKNGKKWSPEEMFFRAQTETHILRNRGHSLFYGRGYEDSVKARDEMRKAYDYYKKLEESLPADEVWKIMISQNPAGRHGYGMEQLFPREDKLPSEALKEAIHQQNMDLKHIRNASAAADAEADQLIETLDHVRPVQEYAQEITSKSYAEAGIHAMEQTKQNPHARRDIFVAPENLWPEMGYGTHPQELIQLVTSAREKMIQMLTKKMIPSRHERRDEKGELKKEPNPFYTGMGKKEAEEYANRHIKATFDTQHLGMWWKHFQAMPGETKDRRRERFKGWFLEQVKDMKKHDIIGHIHAVDSLGGGHHHLPAGQGDLPVKEALEMLKKAGYKGTIISEGHEEDGRFGAGRQMTATWRHFGSPISGVSYGGGAPGGGASWSNVQHSYFQQMQNPYFIFGSYSPSNDWQFWSQVPIE